MTDRLVTLEDRRAVYALLDRMLDWLPPARLSLTRAEASKPGEGRWRRCDRCAATGRVVGAGNGAKPCRGNHDRWPHGHGCRPCDLCDNGWIRGTGDGSDRMLNPGKHDLDTEAQERAQRRRWVDAQIVKIQALQLQQAGKEAAPDEFTRAHDARERLYETGSFRGLELVLELLAITAPGRHAAVVFFVVEGHLGVTPDVRSHLDETVAWIAARMPRPILLPADASAEIAAWKHSLEHGRLPAHRAQRDARNAEILNLVDEHGWSLRRVGRLYDLSHVSVLKIVQGAGERAAVASGPAA